MSEYQSWTTDGLHRHLAELEKQIEAMQATADNIRGEIWLRSQNEWSEKHNLRSGDKVVMTAAFHDWWKRRNPSSYHSYQFNMRYPVGTMTHITSIDAEYNLLSVHWGPTEIPLEAIKEMRQAYLDMEK